MYSLLRQLHLYTAFLLLAFVAMYFITGYTLTHGNWFREGETGKQTRNVTLAISSRPTPLDETSIGPWFQKELNLRGKPQPAKKNSAGSWKFSVNRPGYTAEATLTADFTQARVAETFQDWKRTMAVYHRMHGYGGGWFYNLWVLLYDLASLAMIVFAVSGVYLWFKLVRSRLPGWIVLGCGFALTLSMALYFLLAA